MQGYTGCKQSTGSLGLSNFIKKNIDWVGWLKLTPPSFAAIPAPQLFPVLCILKKWILVLLGESSPYSVLLGFCVVRNLSPCCKPPRYAVFLGFCSGTLCLLVSPPYILSSWGFVQEPRPCCKLSNIISSLAFVLELCPCCKFSIYYVLLGLCKGTWSLL